MKKKLLFLSLLCVFTGLFAQTPVASVTSGATSFCYGGSAVLHSSIATGIRWYRNGSPTAATTQNYTVTSEGTYTVMYNGNNSNAINITVNPLPTAGIAPAGTNNKIYICQGSSQLLGASDAGPGGSYLWSTGATTRTISVSTAGIYWVTVTNGNGCSKTSAEKTVYVAPYPASVSIAANGSTAICAGGSVVLSAGTAQGYQWFRNNILISGATSSTYTATAAGNYSVKALSGTCYSNHSNYINVTVYSLPLASISPSGTVSICQNGVATLSANSAGIGGSYLWSTGETTQSINVSTSGSYTVQITNYRGCSKTSAATVVDVADAPVISASGPVRFCPGGSVTLTCSPASAYIWSNGDTTQSITVSDAAVYSVIAIDNNRCEGTSNTIEVVNYPEPIVDAGPDQFIYTGFGPSQAHLQSSVVCQGTPAYLWSTSEVTPDITVAPATTNCYYLNVTNENNCSKIDSVMVNVLDISCGNNGDKVVICHDGQPLCVSPSAVASHLEHGDALGACSTSSARFSQVSYNGSMESFDTHELLAAFPNPFNSSTMLNYELHEDAHVKIEVYNLLGSLVKVITDGYEKAGQHSVALDLNDLAAEDGVYFIKFHQGAEQSIIRVVKNGK